MDGNLIRLDGAVLVPPFFVSSSVRRSLSSEPVPIVISDTQTLQAIRKGIFLQSSNACLSKVGLENGMPLTGLRAPFDGVRTAIQHKPKLQLFIYLDNSLAKDCR